MGTVTKLRISTGGFGLSVLPMFVSLCLLGAYLLATHEAFLWICNELSVGTLAFSAVTAVAGFAVLIWKFGLPEKPISLPAALLIGVSGLLSIFTFPILQQLSAGFALLGAYGFFISLSRVSGPLWRKGLIMAVLAAMALPFALVPGTGMGFYLRLLTADAAAQLLALIGHSSLGAHDVLIFDNGIAQVDLPCSGLKSLFTGTGFFLAASLIMRREVKLKWLTAYAIFALLLIVANTFRVTVLIWVSEILQQRGIAETIHMPLGIMLFCIICICGIGILLKLKPFDAQENVPVPADEKPALHKFAPAVILAVIFVVTSAFQPDPDPRDISRVTLPAALQAQTIALTPTETRFFGARDKTSAKKWLFDYEGLSGSMLVVRSGAANGLHAPEVCMLGNGISVDRMETRDFKSGNYRFLSVDNERRNAVYWMQSEKTVTDDFRKRLSQFAFGGQDDWVMVTILFDDRLNSTEIAEDISDLNELMLALQSHFSAELNRKQDSDELF